MPDKKTLDAMFGQRYKDFGTVGPGLQVAYSIASQHFPIGYIGDKNTPADAGRTVVDQALGREHGLVFHLVLAHDRHDFVKIMDDVDSIEAGIDGAYPSITVPCDGLIIPRTGKPFVVEAFLGDCACIVVSSKSHVGYMHVGWPEITQRPTGVLEEFFGAWPCPPGETSVWMGPCITGKSFERRVIPLFLSSYGTETAWFTKGFSLDQCIIDQVCLLGEIPKEKVANVSIDPFAVRESGDFSWAASDQWAKMKSDKLGFPVCNPRNSAMLFVEG